MFLDRLRAAAVARGSMLCVGLDPDPDRIEGGADGAFEHCAWVVEQTSDVACCYKPNVAFWEAYGAPGWEALRRLREQVPSDIPVLLDAKRSDVGLTQRAYGRAIFDVLGMSAVTVHAWHGAESLREMTAWSDRGVYVVALSSNPGSADLQHRISDGRAWYEHVADLAASVNEHGNVGVVAGATQPEHVARLRASHPDLPFLLPGLGGQGADVAAIVAAAATDDPAATLFSATRSIMYAADPHREAVALRDQINAARAVPSTNERQ